MTTGKAERGVTLDPMTEEEFVAWVVPSVRGYAQAHVESGRFTREEALRAAKAEYMIQLSDGLRSENHHLYTVRDAATREDVGVLWLNLRPKAGEPEAYVYDIVVREDQRGKGYGRATMLACLQRARELGAASVGLHVFGHNKIAWELYSSLGFIETNVMMSLPLLPEGN